MNSEAPRTLVFGVFEIDFRRHELRRGGRRVRLQEQPYKILVALLERPGELVSRDELRSRLWPGGTYVDHETSINVAVMKLRDVLGDSTEEPRFIETVPRLGYRFVAPVEERGAVPSPEAAERERLRAAASEVRAKEWLMPASTVKVAVPPGGRWRRPRLAMAAAGMLIAAAAAGWVVWRQSSASDPRFRSLGILRFENSGQGAAAESLAIGVQSELVTSLERIDGLELRVFASPILAREAAVDIVVSGSVERVGTRLRVSARLVGAANERALWAGRYECEEADFASLPSEVARDVARQVVTARQPAL